MQFIKYKYLNLNSKCNLLYGNVIIIFQVFYASSLHVDVYLEYVPYYVECSINKYASLQPCKISSAFYTRFALRSL